MIFHFSENWKFFKTSIRTITELKCGKHRRLYRNICFGRWILYNMVRILVGTLIDVGISKR